MNDLMQIGSKANKGIRTILSFAALHRVVLLLTVASLAILSAVLLSSTYVNPERDEERFLELQAEIRYSNIDESIVEKLQKTQDDREIEVNSDLVPNRNNPFSE
jgi:hypothetical protein